MWKNNLFYIFLIVHVFCFRQGFAQEEVKTSLAIVLQELAYKHNVLFNYESDLIDESIEVLFNKNLSVAEQIENLSQQTQFVFSLVSNRIIAIYKPFIFCGYIKDQYSNEGLVGATITAGRFHTISNAEGFFKIDLYTPNTIITVRHLGFKPKKINVSKSNNQCLSILLEEEAIQIEPMVLPSYIIKGIDKLASGDTQLNFATFSLLPGLIDSDVLHGLQSLPAVQSTDDTVANINVRGGSHDQNLILWDGIKMYQSGHFFGLISSFHPQISKKVVFTKNGTDAAYSDGISGTIHLKSNKKQSSHFKGNLAANLVSTDGFFEIPVNEKNSFKLAVRKSNDFLSNGPTFKKYFDRITQHTEVALNEANVINLNKKFRFNDIALQGLHTLSKKDFLRINFLWIANRLSFDETAIVEESSQSRTSKLAQNSLAGGVNYQRVWSSNWSSELSVYETDYFLKAENVNVLSKQRLVQENVVSETGLKAQSTYSKNAKWKILAGYEFKETGITSLNDIDLPRYRKLKADVVRSHAFFGQYSFTSSDDQNLIMAGIRTNYLDPLDVFLLEPRLRYTYTIFDGFRVELMGEMKHQYTSQIINFQNDFLGIEKRKWQLANNSNIPIMKSKQISFGTTYEVKDWLLDVNGYFKHVKGITAQSQEFATKYEFVEGIGSYQVSGVDVLVRKRFRNLSSWISYSGMHNTYLFPTFEQESFPSNFDIPHAINFGMTYTIGTLKFSGGINWRKGRPYSAPTSIIEPIAAQINFGQTNSQRLDDYIRADASIVYRKKIRNKLDLELGASLWNIFNSQNIINSFYRINSAGNVIRLNRSSLGSTQNIVLKLLF